MCENEDVPQTARDDDRGGRSLHRGGLRVGVGATELRPLVQSGDGDLSGGRPPIAAIRPTGRSLQRELPLRLIRDAELGLFLPTAGAGGRGCRVLRRRRERRVGGGRTSPSP